MQGLSDNRQELLVSMINLVDMSATQDRCLWHNVITVASSHSIGNYIHFMNVLNKILSIYNKLELNALLKGSFFLIKYLKWLWLEQLDMWHLNCWWHLSFQVVGAYYLEECKITFNFLHLCRVAELTTLQRRYNTFSGGSPCGLPHCWAGHTLWLTGL